MNKELEEVFKRLDLFKPDMNKNIEDMYNRLYITFDDNEIGYLLDYIEQLQQKNKDLHNKIDKAIEYLINPPKKIWEGHSIDEVIRILKVSDVDE